MIPHTKQRTMSHLIFTLFATLFIIRCLVRADMSSVWVKWGSSRLKQWSSEAVTWHTQLNTTKPAERMWRDWWDEECATAVNCGQDCDRSIRLRSFVCSYMYQVNCEPSTACMTAWQSNNEQWVMWCDVRVMSDEWWVSESAAGTNPAVIRPC